MTLGARYGNEVTKLVHAKAQRRRKGAKGLDDIEAYAREAVDCGLRLHRRLGPGLFESVYETLLASMLEERGLRVECQKMITAEIEGIVLTNAFKVDILIERRLIIELKSVERALPVHSKQVLTYLRLMDLPLGLLMNFGEETFRTGVKRIANNLSAFPSS
jgi:iron complex transport system substrate-binding protein